ncbi:MAG: response regulator [Defluviitaleaceae bacterium]|nr:response regulator [Defluviitaleaceae bacterium]MCL2240118.1 response regulator [Defluviitaleaceae bacterium]
MAYKIVAVDDVQLNLDILAAILDTEYDVTAVTSGAQALALMAENQPDLVLLDLNMPQMDGFEMLSKMRENPAMERIPVIFVTAEQEDYSEEKGLSLGAVDYIRKPYNSNIIRIKIRNHIELKAYRDDLAGMVEERTKQLTASHEAIIMGMSLLSESRDGITGAHIARIKSQTRLLTNKIAEMYPDLLDKELAGQITTYSPLHDVGKVAIPDSVLKKSGGLTREEFDLMKSHTWGGGDLLRQMVEFLVAEHRKPLKVAIDIAECHHERFDGTGYPDGLAGEDIPFAARIVALPDVYDALRSTRPYKRGFTHEESLDIILKGDGRTDPAHFDPVVLEAFRAVHEEMADAFDTNPDPQIIPK